MSFIRLQSIPLSIYFVTLLPWIVTLSPLRIYLPPFLPPLELFLKMQRDAYSMHAAVVALSIMSSVDIYRLCVSLVIVMRFLDEGRVYPCDGYPARDVLR